MQLMGEGLVTDRGTRFSSSSEHPDGLWGPAGLLLSRCLR